MYRFTLFFRLYRIHPLPAISPGVARLHFAYTYCESLPTYPVCLDL